MSTPKSRSSKTQARWVFLLPVQVPPSHGTPLAVRGLPHRRTAGGARCYGGPTRAPRSSWAWSSPTSFSGTSSQSISIVLPLEGHRWTCFGSGGRPVGKAFPCLSAITPWKGVWGFWGRRGGPYSCTSVGTCSHMRGRRCEDGRRYSQPQTTERYSASWKVAGYSPSLRTVRSGRRECRPSMPVGILTSCSRGIRPREACELCCPRFSRNNGISTIPTAGWPRPASFSRGSRPLPGC